MKSMTVRVMKFFSFIFMVFGVISIVYASWCLYLAFISDCGIGVFFCFWAGLPFLIIGFYKIRLGKALLQGNIKYFKPMLITAGALNILSGWFLQSYINKFFYVVFWLISYVIVLTYLNRPNTNEIKETTQKAPAQSRASKKTLIIIALFAIISTTSAVLHRKNIDIYPVDRGLYSALRSDVGAIAAVIKNEIDPLAHGLEPLIFAIALLDVPFSFVSDTMLLPYDIIQARKNIKRITKILDKFLPGFTLIRNNNTNNDNDAYFLLVSPRGERSVFNRLAVKRLGGNIYPRVNDFLVLHKIKLLNEIQAKEFIILFDAILYNGFITDRWNYVPYRQGMAWIIECKDRKTGQIRLGNTRELKFDNNGFLTEVRAMF